MTSAIERAIELRPALDGLFAMGKYDKGRKAGGLKHCRLEEEEWDLLSQLDSVLGVSNHSFWPLAFISADFARLLMHLLAISGLPICNSAHLEDQHTTSSRGDPRH